MIIKKDKKNHIIPNPKTVDGYKCYICNRPATEEHHCIYGRGKRQVSDRERLTVPLCERCHRLIHTKHIYDKEIQAMAQTTWLIEKGGDNEKNRQKWYELFYKFYDL